MTNFDEALEGARTLYHEAVNDYNKYVSFLTDDPTDEQLHKREILLNRSLIMQDYFKNILEAKRSFDPSGDE